MKYSIKFGQGLAWVAWFLFLTSLFLPVETHGLSGPCAWPCGQPFTNYGWQNAVFFLSSILVFAMYIVQAIYIAVFDSQTLDRVIESVSTMGIYTVIGLGQFLVALAPLWPLMIKKPSWQRLHLWLVIASALAVLAYTVFPKLRLGLELLSGYYLWAFSFFLLLLASFLVYTPRPTRGVS